MSIRVTYSFSNASQANRDLTINSNDVRNSKSLKSTIQSRLQNQEDVSQILINGKTYLSFEEIPLNELKNNGSMTVIVDKV